MLRLDRLLVSRGFGSRREVTAMVRRGAVLRGDEVLRDPAAKLDADVLLSVHGEASAPPPWLVAWHKPLGVVTTRDDPWGRSDLGTALPPAYVSTHHAVGRLDRDTSGLLLLSRDGALTQHLLHPRRAIPRTYVATIDVDPPSDLSVRLTDGVLTGEGVVTAVVEAIEGRAVRLTVTEGKHRMVRRMLHNAGASVVGLHRVAYGPISLGDLPVGEARPVSDAIVKGLRSPG